MTGEGAVGPAALTEEEREGLSAALTNWLDDDADDSDDQIHAAVEAILTARADRSQAAAEALDEVAQERARQIAKGYTPEHDDAHTIEDLAGFAYRYLNAGVADRVRLVKAAAVLVAAIESMDRRAAHGQDESGEGRG